MTVAEVMRERIRGALHERGLSLNDLAALSGVHRSTVYRAMSEEPRHAPSSRTLDKLLSAVVAQPPTPAPEGPHERLRQARIAVGHSSAADAARALRIAYSTYAGHENGSRGISADEAKTYASHLGVTPEWLLFGTPSVPSPAQQATGEELQPARRPGGSEETGRPSLRITSLAGGKAWIEISGEVPLKEALEIAAIVERAQA